ncbi:hypothetical protein SAMN02799630_04076 [Paenibacillus sp. UNCCL117]|uniref:hypothetical protein n=1 Tax=unclassified Paenibacillus TaxID=185978 RepID=UPI000887DDF3|nr:MULTISPECIES: hypothetical protein [unclassified Paenibacillus]SDD80024.1 hypothetical protein SAMN04488602_113141 [Paenibacillus sp. cl123]SFW53330.1 hypothetical protein SAMN02799630_04076 [Paenibacillus sp. UNCCL117]
MSDTPIFFQFATNHDAYMALDTLEELGYRVSLHTETERTVLHVHVDRGDLTSALEIGQAHGGRLLETDESPSEAAAFAMAYDPEGFIPIPAHLVQDEGADAEQQPDTSASAYANLSSGAYEDNQPYFDPSGDDYDGFDAGIHM